MNMIKIELSFETYAEAQAAMTKLAQPEATGPKSDPTREALVRQNHQNLAEHGAHPREAANEVVNHVTTSSAKPVDSAPPPPPPAPAVTYDDLKQSVIKLVSRDPKAVQAICASFGVKSFQGTPAEVWPVAKEAIDAKLAELDSQQKAA